MTMTRTRTYAIIYVSAGTWAEVHDKLKSHGAIYGHAFVDHADGPLIDMDGIALQATTEEDWTKRDSADGLVTAIQRAGELRAELEKAKLIAVEYESECRIVRARCNVMAEADDNGRWIWMSLNSEDNHLETMGEDMTVQITAGHLRAMIDRAPNRANELLRDCLVFLDKLEERRAEGLLRVPPDELGEMQQRLMDHLPDESTSDESTPAAAGGLSAEEIARHLHEVLKRRGPDHRGETRPASEPSQHLVVSIAELMRRDIVRPGSP